MRIRSTGLGKTELECELTDLRGWGNHLFCSMNSVAPVHWHIRVVVEPGDVRKVAWMMIKGVLKIGLLWSLIKAFLSNKPIKDVDKQEW